MDPPLGTSSTYSNGGKIPIPLTPRPPSVVPRFGTGVDRRRQKRLSSDVTSPLFPGQKGQTTGQQWVSGSPRATTVVLVDTPGSRSYGRV